MKTRVTPLWRAVIVVLTMLGILLALNAAFFWNPFGIVILPNSYLFFLLGCFLPMVFLIFPVKKGLQTNGVPWYDAGVALLVIVICAYFGWNGEDIINMGWDKSLSFPAIALVFSFALWGIALEALRRTAGLIVTGIAFVFSVYPVVAMEIPVPFLQGIQYGLADTARIHVMGNEGIMGLPLQTAGSILIGFLLFGVALQHTGAATFFFNVARSMFGRFRGGQAKVSVVSSGLMGMMSGSAVSNVLTTGPMTIPAMKKSGFPGRYAAGVEATASTGGTITPPIMGAAAFLMVAFVGVPYTEIAIAAAIPALLYYLGTLFQVDAYAAKAGLGGESQKGMPNVLKVLVQGWPYVLAFGGLIGVLVVTGNERQAPYWIVGLLLIIAMFYGPNRLTLKSFYEFLYASGRTISEIIGIIAGVGLIVGGLSMTGVSLSMAREILELVGDNLWLILITGAVVSFVLGMGMTVSAVYVFLAIIMAPALTGLGINPIAAHLFVIYWATVSYITPPVALASFAAANIARTPPMATSLVAMRLGMVKYIVPFAFVLNPALVAQESSLLEIAYTSIFAIVGVFFLACAFEGWAIGVNRLMNIPMRIVLFAAGLLTFAPELSTSVLGLVIALAALAITRFWNAGGPEESAARERARNAKLPPEEQLTDDQLQEGDKQQQAAEPLPELATVGDPTVTNQPLRER